MNSLSLLINIIIWGAILHGALGFIKEPYRSKLKPIIDLLNKVFTQIYSFIKIFIKTDISINGGKKTIDFSPLILIIALFAINSII